MNVRRLILIIEIVLSVIFIAMILQTIRTCVYESFASRVSAAQWLKGTAPDNAAEGVLA